MMPDCCIYDQLGFSFDSSVKGYRIRVNSNSICGNIKSGHRIFLVSHTIEVEKIGLHKSLGCADSCNSQLAFVVKDAMDGWRY